MKRFFFGLICCCGAMLGLVPSAMAQMSPADISSNGRRRPPRSLCPYRRHLTNPEVPLTATTEAIQRHSLVGYNLAMNLPLAGS